ATWRGQRPLEEDQLFAAGLDGFVGQPVLERVESLLAGINLHPVDLAFAAVGLLHRGVHDTHAGAPDVAARPVTFNEGDDGLIGDRELAVRDRDLRAALGRY